MKKRRTVTTNKERKKGGMVMKALVISGIITITLCVIAATIYCFSVQIAKYILIAACVGLIATSTSAIAMVLKDLRNEKTR